ncbi:hypothetical protein ES703_73212 [subsurface metagenome]
MVMDWLGAISNLVSRVPIERILFPPRDGTKELEKFINTRPRAEPQKEGASEGEPTPTLQEPAKATKTVATACVPCALGHFSTSAGLLNEIARFKGEGITSDEILDRVAKVQEEQNALERVDLTPENIQALPPWEKELAEGALSQSRKLRHSIESFTSIAQLNQAAADTSSYYKELNRKWFKGRFAHLGPEKAQRIADEVGKLSPEDKDRVLKRAEELIEEA